MFCSRKFSRNELHQCFLGTFNKISAQLFPNTSLRSLLNFGKVLKNNDPIKNQNLLYIDLKQYPLNLTLVREQELVLEEVQDFAFRRSSTFVHFLKEVI